MTTITLKKISIKPLDDRVLIKPEEAEDRTNSGIFLPEGAKEKPTIGKVAAVGPGKLTDDGTRAPMSVKKGDRIVFGKYAGTEVDLNDEPHTIMKESELLGIID
jgi:chaperonin GroES